MTDDITGFERYVREEYGLDDFELPTTWAVCPDCRGRGARTLPDCVFTADDFAEDPDFADDYLSGVYDTTCERCGGRTTVRDVDERRARDLASLEGRASLWDDFAAYCTEMWQMYAIEAQERRMGA